MMDDPRLLRKLIDLAPDVIYFKDAEGRYLCANEAAGRYLGVSADEVVGRTDHELFPEEAADLLLKNHHEVLASGEPRFDEAPLDLPGGETRVFESNSFPVDEDEVGEEGVAGVVRDVTERHEAEKELALAKKKYEAVFEANPVALVVIDSASGELREVNDAFEDLSGYDREEVQGRRIRGLGIFLDPDRVEGLGERAVEEGGRPEGIVRARRKDGELRDVLLACVAVELDDETLIVGTGQDVSPLKETEQALRRRAFHDPLTGLPNRDLLWDRCEHALERVRRTGERIAVLYIDLDGFKAVNDAHGHATGDRVLVQLTRRLSDRVRGEDTVARVGGDEFVVLLESLSGPEDARRGVERVLEAFAEPVTVDGADAFEVGASCGAVVVEPDAVSASTADAAELVRIIVDRADREMYAVKSGGRGSYRLVTIP